MFLFLVRRCESRSRGQARRDEGVGDVRARSEVRRHPRFRRQDRKGRSGHGRLPRSQDLPGTFIYISF